jgi:hypothetical protein
MDTKDKDYKFKHNVKDAKKRRKTHLIPQVFYEDQGGRKRYVELDDAVRELIFSDIDFGRG